MRLKNKRSSSCPDIVFLDIRFGREKYTGVQAARDIWADRPKIGIIIMSSDDHLDDEYYVDEIRSAGATVKAYGFLSKTADKSEFRTCVKKVLEGRRYMDSASEEAMDRIVDEYSQVDAKKKVALLCIAAGLKTTKLPNGWMRNCALSRLVIRACISN